jgi:hypothetical protein
VSLLFRLPGMTISPLRTLAAELGIRDTGNAATLRSEIREFLGACDDDNESIESPASFPDQIPSQRLREDLRRRISSEDPRAVPEPNSPTAFPARKGLRRRRAPAKPFEQLMNQPLVSRSGNECANRCPRASFNQPSPT